MKRDETVIVFTKSEKGHDTRPSSSRMSTADGSDLFVYLDVDEVLTQTCPKNQ